jgi:hypothetical protein
MLTLSFNRRLRIFNGVELRPDALGVYSFAGLPGEQTLTIACFGAGTAIVDSFSCPPYGVIMTVR